MHNAAEGPVAREAPDPQQRAELLAVLDDLEHAVRLARVAAEGPDPEIAYRYLAEAMLPIRPLVARAADLIVISSAPAPT